MKQVWQHIVGTDMWGASLQNRGVETSQSGGRVIPLDSACFSNKATDACTTNWQVSCRSVFWAYGSENAVLDWQHLKVKAKKVWRIWLDWHHVYV